MIDLSYFENWSDKQLEPYIVDLKLYPADPDGVSPFDKPMYWAHKFCRLGTGRIALSTGIITNPEIYEKLNVYIGKEVDNNIMYIWKIKNTGLEKLVMKNE